MAHGKHVHVRIKGLHQPLLWLCNYLKTGRQGGSGKLKGKRKNKQRVLHAVFFRTHLNDLAYILSRKPWAQSDAWKYALKAPDATL